MLRVRYGILLALTVVLAGGVRLSAEADKADVASVEKLVKQLGSDAFSDREEAAAKLEKLGDAALEPLKKAAKSDDVETRRRAEELVEKIESKGRTERLLAPTRVKLAYRDTPVPEAVVDFARRSGRPVVLAADQVQKLAGRKLTVESEELTFWEALDLFCRKAGLTESFTVAGPLNGPRPLPVVPAPAVAPVPGPAGMARPAIAIARWNAGTDEIVLTDGKRSDLPVSYNGAARVRVLAADAPVLAGARQPGELLIGLGVALEGVGTLQEVTGVKVDKAVDDKDQALALAAQEAPLPGMAVPRAGVMIVNVRGRPFGGLPVGYDHPTVVRLKAGEKPAKALKELSGVASAQVQIGEAAMTVENVLKSAGQPAVKGAEGGSLRVTEIVKQDDGQYKVTVELALPNPATGNPPPFPPAPGIGKPIIQIAPAPIPVAPAPAPAPVPAPPENFKEPGQKFQVQIQIGGNGAAPAPGGPAAPPAAVPALRFPGNPMASLPLTLVDAKGKKYAETATLASRVKIVDKTTVQEVTLLFKAERDQGEPAKLVYSTFKTVALEIPFQLKDITLP